MYGDPAKIRSHVVKVRFSDEEHSLIQAFVNYSGEQKAALLRELILSQVSDALEVPVQTVYSERKRA